LDAAAADAGGSSDPEGRVLGRGRLARDPNTSEQRLRVDRLRVKRRLLDVGHRGEFLVACL